MLFIKNVSKSYDGVKKALNNVSLEIMPGDIYGFIGHNGAGKTTLLKSIAGIIDFDEGEIKVGNYSIAQNPIEVKRVISYIPDNPDVYDTLSGIQYLDFIADVFQINLTTRKEIIEKYATMFEIADVLNNPISSYSHGMKQKIVIISALIHEPKLMLLDEPFVGLDPKASYLLKEVFKDMCSRGTAIFFSTHVLEVAEKLCNKVAIIRQGEIVAAGDTKSVIQNESLEQLFLELMAEKNV